MIDKLSSVLLALDKLCGGKYQILDNDEIMNAIEGDSISLDELLSIIKELVADKLIAIKFSEGNEHFIGLTEYGESKVIKLKLEAKEEREKLARALAEKERLIKERQERERLEKLRLEREEKERRERELVNQNKRQTIFDKVKNKFKYNENDGVSQSDILVNSDTQNQEDSEKEFLGVLHENVNSDIDIENAKKDCIVHAFDYSDLIEDAQDNNPFGEDNSSIFDREKDYNSVGESSIKEENKNQIAVIERQIVEDVINDLSLKNTISNTTKKISAVVGVVSGLVGGVIGGVITYLITLIA